MKRTRFALFSAAALVAAAVAGCSSSSSTPAAAAASPGSANFGVNATGTVQFWARTVSKTLAQKLVSEFNATHSNLKVKLTPHLDQR
jgi:ABC-type glycerol-3-phosphate transport system substrate-binding protein